MAADESIDVIQALLVTPFKLQPPEMRLQMLTFGRPKPDLNTNKQEDKRNPDFNGAWYEMHDWLCGSFNLNKFFCWPCLLMRPESSSWSSTGFDDFRKINFAGVKHGSSKLHSKAIIEYNGAMTDIGLQSELITAIPNDDSPGNSESESESEFLRHYLVPKSEDLRDRKLGNEALSKQTLTFRAWQHEKAINSHLRVGKDRVLLRRKRRLARIDVQNAKLTSQLLQLEIELLESKIEYQKNLNNSLIHDAVTSKKAD